MKIGEPAPSFSAIDDQGKPISLADFEGKSVVVYFYPKDNTPGCTREACDFRDQWTAIQKRGAVVLGVSKDSAASHAKFKKQFKLPFPLIVDADAAIMKKFGAWGKKSLYGKTYEGTLRSTVVIGPDGRVKAHFPRVKVDGHVDEVLKTLE